MVWIANWLAWITNWITYWITLSFRCTIVLGGTFFIIVTVIWTCIIGTARKIVA